MLLFYISFYYPYIYIYTHETLSLYTPLYNILVFIKNYFISKIYLSQFYERDNYTGELQC